MRNWKFNWCAVYTWAAIIIMAVAFWWAIIDGILNWIK